jgi:hypothetical protein
MPTSEAAIAGIGANGLGWRKEIHGLKRLVDHMVSDEGPYENRDADACEKLLHSIWEAFDNFLNRNPELREIVDRDFSFRDTLDWFRDENPSYEFAEEEGAKAEDFIENYKFRMNELYDFCDYHRILIK